MSDNPQWNNQATPPPLPGEHRDGPAPLWRRPVQWLDAIVRRLSQTATHESHGAVELACPQCGRPMVKGTVALECPWSSIGLSGLMPIFRARYRKQTIVERNETKDAFRCDACATVLMIGRERREAPCLHCDGMIPPGGTLCPKCGWAYQRPQSSMRRY